MKFEINKKYLDNYIKLYISIFNYSSKLEENFSLSDMLNKKWLP